MNEMSEKEKEEYIKEKEAEIKKAENDFYCASLMAFINGYCNALKHHT